VHVLIEASKRLENRGYEGKFSITIAGGAIHADPSYVDELKHSAADLRSRIDFTGHVDDVLPLLADSDVLVCASVSPEPFGQVLVQGMSAGLAVVATAHGGPVEMLSEDAGILVTPDDPDALAHAMAQLIDHRERLTEVANACRRRATTFDDTVTVRMMDDALLSLLPS
jgi:glycosyltransferase involved in cell wall biosynthesis